MDETREGILKRLEQAGRLVIRRSDYSATIREILGKLYEEGRVELIVMNEAVIVQSLSLPDAPQ